MKIMKVLLFIVLSALSSFSAFANMTCTPNGCSGVPYKVLAYPNGKVNIWPIEGTPPIGGAEGPLDCRGFDNNGAITIQAGEGQDRVYSMVLTSISTNKPIFIRTPNDANSDCVIIYAQFQQ